MNKNYLKYLGTCFVMGILCGKIYDYGKAAGKEEFTKAIADMVEELKGDSEVEFKEKN